VVVQIPLNAARTLDLKRARYRSLTERFAEAMWLRPKDLWSCTNRPQAASCRSISSLARSSEVMAAGICEKK